ncbi:hypothetical protein ACFCYH_18485 [Streptomyces sp. NPDC056400]|uniref:hypothetical protein n=1 Tax=Streptomyces sp. NPDC056400 TaxID=3345808 RepID=UPI0035E2E9FC
MAQPTTPASAKVSKIADFEASETLLPNWLDHLALWADRRHLVPDALPLDQCVVDLRAPELEPTRLVDRVGLARIAAIALNDLPDPKHGRRDLPPPQIDTSDGPRWSEPVARDWAERRRSTEGPAALLADTTTFGPSQPRGLVADHNLLTKIIKDALEDEDTKSSK